MKVSLICLVLLGICLAGCRRTDVRDFSVSLPTATAADAPALSAALQGYGGIEKESIAFDASSKTLTLRYDSMQLAKKNIEISLAQAGFTANGVTPESVGAKPKSAR